MSKTYKNMSKEDSVPRFEKPIDEILSDVRSLLLSCKYGQSVVITKKRTPKSQKQLGNNFGNIVDKILHEANEVRQDGADGLLAYYKDKDIPKGIPATKDLVMKILYRIAPTYNDLAEEITLSKMDTKQAADFQKRAALGMSGYVHIPDPDPNWNQNINQS